ncbi:tetratricopeptide repeat protein [Streptomyces tuirus]|uniref:Tetratricopeptide repeat protein n=1 Tax=Streptomyces tuirus TaxID=68278 RepID=A0A941FK43_9ACTN|nr:tetratricopeptide repeat protein [Streptomyces tuirus]
MEFRVLGAVEAWVDARPVALGHAKQRCVLAVLLCEAGRVVSAERLIDRVWGENPPGSVRNILSGYVGRLRTALRASGARGARLTRSSGGYVLDVDPEHIDVHRFRRRVTEARTAADAGQDEPAADLLGDALAQWHGEALSGLTGVWAEETRAGLVDEHLTAELQYHELGLRLGRHQRALERLRQLAAAHPLDERAVRHLMTALHRGDRRAEALEAYEDTRHRLAEELGVDPGPELQRLHRNILRGPAEARNAGNGSRVVPAELPHDVAGFSGRTEALARLTTLLDAHSREAVVISVISGAAGVGKTALAIHVAHRVRDRFPDGQLYVDLRGYDHESAPVTPQEALGQLLRSLGLTPQQIPADPDEQARRYRSLLDGRRMLIMLDNAASVRQVRPLLPGSPTCRVLVTSRHRLTGLVAQNGAEPLRLDVLAPREARELLAAVLGEQRVTAEPEAAEELSRRCGRLPLALRVAAAQLLGDRQRPIAGLAAELAGGDRLGALELDDDRSSAVRATFDLSYRALPRESARLFRLLGLITGPDITRRAAAALLDTSESRAGSLLTTLATAHLIESPAPDRYRFHDLLRDYARERAGAEEPPPSRAAAEERLYACYLRTAETCGGALPWQYPQLPRDVAGPDGTPATPDEIAAALSRLESERAGLLAAVEHTAASGPRHFAWRLMTALLRYCWLGLPRSAWQTAAQAALHAAETDDDRRGQAAMHRSLGIAHWDMGRHTQAVHHHTQVLRLHRETGDPLGQALALSGLGLVDTEAARLDDALAHFTEALRLSREADRLDAEAQALIGLGLAYRDRGRLERSAEHLEQALRILRTAGAGDATHRLPALSAVYWEQGRLEEAAGALRATDDEPRDENPTTLDITARIESDLGRHQQALKYAEQSLRLAEATGRRRLLAIALGTLADAHLRTGRAEEATRTYDRALSIAREVGNQRTEAEILLGLAEAHRVRHHHAPALTCARQALALAHQGGFDVVKARTLTELAALHTACGRPSAGRSRADAAVALHRRTGHRLGEAGALVVLGDALHALADPTADGARHRARAIYADTGARPPEGLRPRDERPESHDRRRPRDSHS